MFSGVRLEQTGPDLQIHALGQSQCDVEFEKGGRFWIFQHCGKMPGRFKKTDARNRSETLSIPVRSHSKHSRLHVEYMESFGDRSSKRCQLYSFHFSFIRLFLFYLITTARHLLP